MREKFFFNKITARKYSRESQIVAHESLSHDFLEIDLASIRHLEHEYFHLIDGECSWFTILKMATVDPCDILSPTARRFFAFYRSVFTKPEEMTLPARTALTISNLGCHVDRFHLVTQIFFFFFPIYDIFIAVVCLYNIQSVSFDSFNNFNTTPLCIVWVF